MNWVGKNTEYETAGTGINFHNGKKFYDSGMAQDWCFKEFRIPSFVFEILSLDYFPSNVGYPIDISYLVGVNMTILSTGCKPHYLFFMYLLVNIDNLRQWKTPDIQPPLPDGVPPEPLQ